MKITLREHAPPRDLPSCASDHRPRYMVDSRRAESKGGHFIECRCSSTPRCRSFALAWAHWHKIHGTHPAQTLVQRTTAVPQLQLRLIGGTDR